MEKTLKMLWTFVQNEQDELIKNTIPMIDFDDISERILNAEGDSDIGMSLEDALFMILNITQYIETETTMESVIMDDTYDKLKEKYEDMTGHAVVGTNGTSGGNKPTAQHKYPELRGSLDKVHFVYDNQIPSKDSRKSLEGWFRTMVRKLSTTANMNNPTVELGYTFKFDGISGVFEASENTLDETLTRKDVDENVGTVVTHIFKDKSMMDIFDGVVPPDTFNKSSYGVQTEMFVRMDKFEEFKKLFVKPPKNHRSAASMIINTSASEYNPEWYDYLTIEPLHIASTEPIELSDDDYQPWVYVGMENGRYQYVRTCHAKMRHVFDCAHDLEDALEEIEHVFITAVYIAARDMGIPIDGVVFTITNDDIAQVLGRSDNKNKYQVAYKFAAGVAKTKILDVEFSLGPVTGVITPVLKLEPIVIMGNTIEDASLSNIDKYERFNIHRGDEIFVKYNIVPTVYKDDTCVETDDKIEFITHCPKCGEELTIHVNKDNGNRTVKCDNRECPGKIAGRIANYINKLDIVGVGPNIVEDLISIGVLRTIGDLYRIPEYKIDIINLPGYGETKYNNIVSAIRNKIHLYPHELLGSVGIPDIGRRVMKTVCKEIDFNRLLTHDDNVISDMMNIKGIGEKIALKICDGMLRYQDTIRDILRYVDIKEYELEDSTTPKIKVLFTTIRDKELEKLLVEKYNAEIQSSYTKATDIVIVKDENSSSAKITAAKNDGKSVLTIEEARRKFTND